MLKKSEAPRLYIACLASYNAGRLHGAWIDVDDDADALREAIDAMLAASPCHPAEDWAVHDHEGWGGYEPGEYEDLDQLVELVQLIAQHGEVVSHVAAYVGGLSYLDEVRAMLDEHYRGAWPSYRDFVYDTAHELLDIPEHIEPWFDYETYGRDLLHGGDIVTFKTSDGQTHVFWTC